MRRISKRRQYYDRIRDLINQDVEITPEQQSHWAKYQCILISGYLEVAVKEIILAYGQDKSHRDIYKYVENTWPRSQNMNTQNINEALEKFNSEWAKEFTSWLDEDGERKGNINTLIAWRNGISHGNERDTNGVTRHTVRDKFKTAHELVCKLEAIVPSELNAQQ